MRTYDRVLLCLAQLAEKRAREGLSPLSPDCRLVEIEPGKFQVWHAWGDAWKDEGWRAHIIGVAKETSAEYHAMNIRDWVFIVEEDGKREVVAFEELEVSSKRVVVSLSDVAGRTLQ